MLAGQLQQARHQLGHHGLAVGAGDAHHRDAAVVVAFARGEQVIDDGAAHRAGFAVGGLQVHQQAGAGIDLDEGAALLGERARDVLRHQVDPGDVQAHHAGGQRSVRGHAGMHAVGHVEGDIAVALYQHMLAFGRHGKRVEALALEFEARGRIQPHFVERVVFGAAAARVGIDLRLDQFLDGRLAVAAHAGGLAHGGGHQAAAHYQQAVFVAQHEAFDDDAAAFVDGHAIGGLDFLAGGQVGEYATAMVAVVGLDDHRQADVLGGVPGVGGAFDHPAFGYGHAAGFQQALGQVLVARDALGDGGGAVGLGGPDAALAAAIAKLHQVALRQAQRGDAAVVGGVHDAGGAWTQAVLVHQAAQMLHRLLDVVGAVLDGGHHQVAGGEQGGASDVLVPGPHDHLVDAADRCLPCLAETARHAGQVLQLKRNVFQDMARPGAFLEPLQEAAALTDAAAMLDQRGQPCRQALVEPRNLVGGKILQFPDIDPRLQHRPICPHIRAAQRHDIENLNVLLFH